MLLDELPIAGMHVCSLQEAANLSAYGDLILEAQFRQAGSKTTRLLFLFEEMLLIVKQRNSNYVCKDYIMVSSFSCPPTKSSRENVN